jgi:ATP-dependent DNA helicase DinG
VAEEIERLLEVSRGRALCLFTSWSGLQHVSDRLQRLDSPVIWPLRAQGDAPRNALLAWFTQTPHSVLLATRSFWEGVDIPGEDLSLVVLDKMPFPTPGDPLHSARMGAIEEAGGHSFADYMTPLMTLSLKQGFGRLIRRTSDWGVVAILDERLTSKGYGRRARSNLPAASPTRDFREVYRFYRRMMGVEADFALNVWARGQGDAPEDVSVWWRCRLLRMQDGRADELVGEKHGLMQPAAEMFAVLQGLQDLRDRIAKANRSPSDFSVELRHSNAMDAWLASNAIASGADEESEQERQLRRQWQDEQMCWKSITRIAIAPESQEFALHAGPA